MSDEPLFDDRSADEPTDPADYDRLRLLEQTHNFPCPYLFKVIGLPENNFVGRVLAAVRRELAEDAEPPFSSRKSAKGRHVSVSIEPTVAEGQQIIRIYRNLQAVEGVEMLF